MSGIRGLGPAALLFFALPGGALASPDHYIFDADVVLFDDFDSDGHYRFLSVRVDADSLRDNAFIFAELYLSPDGVNWELYHTSEDFEIGGTTSEDEFFIETELVSGYPTGFYDLLIEIYDADAGTYSDEWGPIESSDFELLPLEDVTQDPRPGGVTIIDGGGGAFAPAWLAALLGTGIWLRRRTARYALRKTPSLRLS